MEGARLLGERLTVNRDACFGKRGVFLGCVFSFAVNLRLYLRQPRVSWAPG